MVHIRLAADVVYVRQMAREIAESLEFHRNDQTRIATAVSEIARNAWQYAGGGEVFFELIPEDQVFQIRVQDHGAGIDRTENVPTHDGSAPGNGMTGASAIMDSFDIETGPGRGTTVTMGKMLPVPSVLWNAAGLTRIAADLAVRPPQTLVEELHRQNQELLRTLNQVREQQENWERLYREMEVTNRDMLVIHDELSDRNQALEHSESRSRLMVNEVTDYAIFLLDPEGAIVTWNVGAERILGHAEATILGSSVEVIFTPEDQRKNVPRQEMKTARECGRVETETWQVRRDGSLFWANCVMTTLRDGEEIVGYVKILRDMTERKRAQDLLQSAYERERHITEVLQSPLLSKTPEDSHLGLSVTTLYEPNLNEAEVGGDFFDAFLVEDGRVALAVGDASGKGLGAALRAMQVKELLRATFSLMGEKEPVPVVERLNRYLCEANHTSGEEGFVTLALVVLDPATQQGVYLCAGCEPPLVVRADSGAESLAGPGMPLSAHAQATYEAYPFSLQPGDTLVLLTDGITEARHQGRFLGYEGMIDLARVAGQLPLGEMGNAILEGARTFAHGRFRDDVCLLLARLPE